MKKHQEKEWHGQELVSVKHVVSFLNKVNKLDNSLLRKLIDTRVSCNEKIVNHPTIQAYVDKKNKGFVGLLGLLNGILGTDRNGYGPITAIYESRKLKGFRVTKTNSFD